MSLKEDYSLGYQENLKSLLKSINILDTETVIIDYDHCNFMLNFFFILHICCLLHLTYVMFIFRLSSADSATLCGNLEEILTFQQGLCVALEDCTK